jgi:monomeric sarcosine oxidase
MANSPTYDCVVVGAGVFGAWTAWHLATQKQRVLLVDAYGAAHSRASSGGETRIIRMGYGADEIYTRWSLRSLEQWKALFCVTNQALFLETGVLWLAGEHDTRLNETIATLQHCGVTLELLDPAALEKRYPQVSFHGVSRGLLEPESGVLLARRAVACVMDDALRHGAQFEIAQISPPRPHASCKLDFIETSSGARISGGQFVFACGPWLGKVFQELLGQRIFPTRQEVLFFGAPPGDSRFATSSLPTWLFQEEEAYGMPDIEARGLKLARDAHGERVDPDTQSRLVSPEAVEWARAFVARRFPALKDAPIVETRVCQYENTSNGDFLIDRHPQLVNVWLAGGGSGHGFKHGPALGQYLAGLMSGQVAAEPRFSLASKATQQKRAVF